MYVSHATRDMIPNFNIFLNVLSRGSCFFRQVCNNSKNNNYKLHFNRSTSFDVELSVIVQGLLLTIVIVKTKFKSGKNGNSLVKKTKE